MKLRSVAAAPALAVALVATAFPLTAQTPQAKPPIAVYWMSVETAARTGLEIPSRAGMPVPPALQGGKRMRLELGSSQVPSGVPRATHAIPPELMLGERLPLVAPARARTAAAPEGVPREPEAARPKGRLLIYWGCGETVRRGQPVVVDFSKLDAKAAARAYRTAKVLRPAGPAPGRHRAYGMWPNQESQQRLPEAASLRGMHFVSGNYTPDIQFSIEERHDFLQPVEFLPVTRSESGMHLLNWKAVSNAIGYFAAAMARGENAGETIVWTSSELQEAGSALLDYLPPVEVERLIKEKIVLPPQVNSCMVPAGVFKGLAAVLNFIAYGDDLDLMHPPRPRDPKALWEPQWSLKVRRKSTATTLLGEQATPNTQ